MYRFRRLDVQGTSTEPKQLPPRNFKGGILAICETILDDSIDSGNFSVSGYSQGLHP